MHVHLPSTMVYFFPLPLDSTSNVRSSIIVTFLASFFAFFMVPSLSPFFVLVLAVQVFFGMFPTSGSVRPLALLFIGLGLLLAPTVASPVATELPTSWGVVILVCGLVGLRLAWRLQGGDASGARAWCLLMALLSLPSLPYSLPVALPALFGAWRLWEGVR